MSIEQLKKKLESEKEEMANRAWGFEGTSIREAGYYKRGHEAATNRLLPLLEKAVEMASFYGDENNWEWSDWYKNMIHNKDLEIMDKSESIANYDSGLGGKKAREFLAEIKKESDE